MRILICLPTYNEELNIKPMIERLQKLNYPIVVVDGHSTDKTVEIAERSGVTILKRDGFGKGSAIVKCLKYAEENNFVKIITIDCDQTYYPEDIPLLISNAKNYDMVVGKRNFKDITFLRRIANYLMNLATNILFFSNVKDMATGFRVIDVAKFKPFLNAESFDIEPQLYAVALREKFSFVEVPIRYDKRIGKSKINLFHFFIIIARLIKERFK